ncbi:MAG: N-acetyltransferase [Chloroflexi bacterium]|jgi:acetyltransferase-like isoleucine patch superfamily enzyme|nr:N-acetyltransferase [Chloroflexota bacterium]
MEASVFAHPTALVETEQIGRGTRVWAFAHIMRGASIGENCNIGDHCFVEAGARIGNNVTIKNGNMIWEGVTLEDGVFVGPSVHFTNDLYPRSARMPEARSRYEDKSWLLPTTIRKGASLGAGSAILPGIIIGEYSMIGAGATVTRDVPPHAIVIGTPARVAGWVCACGQKLDFFDETSTCIECGRHWERSGNTIRERELEKLSL